MGFFFAVFIPLTSGVIKLVFLGHRVLYEYMGQAWGEGGKGGYPVGKWQAAERQNLAETVLLKSMPKGYDRSK